MKTHEEIKKGLELCGVLDGDCENCPYDGLQIICTDRLRKDAIAYIQQLEASLAQAERVRDAAEHDLHLLADGEGGCNVCARFDEGYIPTPPHCRYAWDDDCFRWRGVCEENTKEN